MFVMGKINNSVEIIPIDGPSGLHSRQMDQQRERVDKMSYMINDPFIVQRVRQYLEANVDKTYVDVTEMADFLQTKFKEYTRRKRSAFRGLVKRAYSIVERSYGTVIAPSTSDSEVEECEDDEEDEHNNTMNNQLLQMYNRSQKNMMATTPVQDNSELIDISSDDSSEVPDKLMPGDKSSNGSSSMQPETETVLSSPEKKTVITRLLQQQQQQSPFNANASANSSSANLMETPDRGKKRKSEMSFSSSSGKRKKDVPVQIPSVSFKDVGGVTEVLKDVCKLLLHVKHPEIYRQIGIAPPRGFLLHGPPGCGKTLLANAIAGELKIPLLKVAAPELIGGISGESEERIRELFERASESAPCILFIDEVDAITQNRQQAQKDMERRIVAQLLSCLDDLAQNENGDRVLVIGATNRPDSLDPALRRAGRFDREVCLGIPNVEARTEILKVLTSKLKLTETFDYVYVAKNTPGYVGADLMALTREAAMAAINRVFSNFKTKVLKPKVNESKAELPKIPEEPKQDEKTEEKTDEKPEEKTETPEIESTENQSENAITETPSASTIATSNDQVAPEEKQIDINIDFDKASLQDLISWLHGQAPLTEEQLNDLCINMDDFQRALKCVQPSSKREGFATVPDVTWDDVGSLQDIRQELQMSILAPVRYSEQFKSLGLTTPTGVLLCGPPGCGKTLLAKAVANEAGINFISVKGPELLNMYVGESERAVRQCFQRARNSVPCVIFFDELDALCPKRSDSGEGGASMRVVNQMLTEMDGVEGRNGVFLMAASNRPDIVDPAVLRPGRLDKILYVGLPSAEDRIDILRAITKKGTEPLLAPDVDLSLIGKCERCEGYTGADLAALVREAGVEAIKELMVTGMQMNVKPMVTNEHFKKAITKIRPSVTEKDQKHYEKLRKLYGTVRDTPSIVDEEIMECS